MPTSLLQALLTVSQSPVAAGWLGIAFALGAVASLVVCWSRAVVAAMPVEDDELAFVEEVMDRSTRPPGARSVGAMLPPPLPMPPPPPRKPSPALVEGELPGEDQSTSIDLKLSDLLAQMDRAGGALAGAEDDQTRAWSRAGVACASPASSLRSVKSARSAGALRAMDIAAARRRLQVGGRA